MKVHLLSNKLCLIMLAGFTIRLWAAFTIPLGFDEAHNVILARASIFPVEVAAANVYPPLYFTVWHLWQKLSETLLWNRLLAVILGSASVAATYLLPRKMSLRATATTAETDFSNQYKEVSRGGICHC